MVKSTLPLCSAQLFPSRPPHLLEHLVHRHADLFVQPQEVEREPHVLRLLAHLSLQPRQPRRVQRLQFSGWVGGVGGGGQPGEQCSVGWVGFLATLSLYAAAAACASLCSQPRAARGAPCPKLSCAAPFKATRTLVLRSGSSAAPERNTAA